MLRYLLCMVIMIIAMPIFSQFDIKINLKNYEHDTLIIAYNMGEKTLARDTLASSDQSHFTYQGEESLEPGVYMILVRPDNSFTQFFVNENDQEFEINWDVENPTDVSFKDSEDNMIFNDYIAFLGKKRADLEVLTEEKKAISAAGSDSTMILQKIEALNQDVEKEQKRIIDAYPNSITTLFLKSNISTEIPTYEGTEQEVREKEFNFYKKHYFDNLDLGNPATIRTPFIHQRVMNYVDRLTLQVPDSLTKSIDYVLEKMEPSEDAYRYYLAHFLNTYANKPIIGMDAVYVHIVDNYYAKGKAPWTAQDNLDEIFKTANNIRVSLIGKTFPDITTYLADETPVRIRDVESPYKVIVFWAHTCSHCKKEMPHLIDFQEQFKDKGVKVITVCTKGRELTEVCMDYAVENNMVNMMNTFDASQKYRERIYINSTPKVYILDEDNKILLKDLGVNKLAEVMPEIIKNNPPTNQK